MAKIFEKIAIRKPKTSTFDLSHDLKFSLNMGDLVPILTQEVLPGDHFKINAQTMARMAPMISPVMHRINIYTHFFFVPNRILWPDWETFITRSKDGKKISEDQLPAAPVFTFDNKVVTPGSLANYLGLPIHDGTLASGGYTKVNALPFAAYQRIWKEYYRDQNLQDVEGIDFNLVSGGNEDYGQWMFNTLRKRAWQHDYFTSALPWAQKGDPVSLPLLQPQSDIEVKRNTNLSGPQSTWTADQGATPKVLVPNDVADPSINVGGLYVDGDQIQEQSTTINDLRRAFKLQEWLEKNARAGSRYVESLWAHWFVRSSDKRLQRPEYIGGSKTPMVISEVLQTSESNETAQANMAGHGIAFDKGQFASYTAEEHGFIIGIMSILPDTAYQQGIPRHFCKRQDWMDYAWPEFANIGEQEILNSELYYGPDKNLDVFGYTPRYAEYKQNPCRVAGDFQTSLDFWHMGRIFSSRPNLNESFVVSDPTTRIFAVEDPSVAHIYAQTLFNMTANRRLPYFGTPTI